MEERKPGFSPIQPETSPTAVIQKDKPKLAPKKYFSPEELEDEDAEIIATDDVIVEDDTP